MASQSPPALPSLPNQRISQEPASMEVDNSSSSSGSSTAWNRPLGVVANADYVRSAPARPGILVSMPQTSWFAHKATQPSSETCENDVFGLTIRPTLSHAGIMGLTEDQLRQITGFRPQVAKRDTAAWRYAQRHEAQQVLDFLLLGPISAARQADFLKQAGVTLLLAVRDSRLAASRLLSVQRAVDDLGIATAHVDVTADQHGSRIGALPAAVRCINEHMLGGPDRRVLVFCETGNGLSVAVVAAYVMAVYGTSLAETLGFLTLCRFCISIDEDTKRMLAAYADILQAQRDVWKDSPGLFKPPSPALLAAPDNEQPRGRGRTKRTIEETMDLYDERSETLSQYMPSRGPSAEPASLHLDLARYENRPAFQPFIDTDGMAKAHSDSQMGRM